MRFMNLRECGSWVLAQPEISHPAQGMLRGEELSAAYASADIFMMPSETETLGFVALEAMASGLAVVAVAAGGLVDIVTKPGVIGEPSPAASQAPCQTLHRCKEVDLMERASCVVR